MPATNKSLAINRIPILRSITVSVSNESPESLPPLQVQITVAFENKTLFEPFTINFPLVNAGRSHTIDLTDKSRLSPRRLPDVTESTEATLRLQFRHDGMRSAKNTAIKILAPNEWFNSEPYYQSLVAFSQPNAQEIVPVLQDGMAILSRETRSGSMQGYQAGTERAIEIAAAIFDALRNCNIHYINPPASFENTGQKIRSSSKVLQDGMGTCIDLAVTYAAAAEQAGLHPAIFILQGHAIAGIYTSEEPSLRPVLYEEAEILNAVRSRRIIPIETISYSADRSDSFTDAVDRATEVLEHTDVYGLISVRDARRDGTQPISSSSVPPPPTGQVPQSSSGALSSSFDVSGVVDKFGSQLANEPKEILEQEVVPPRIAQWKKELLDLTFNNRLLNLRPGNEVLSLQMRTGMLAELDDIIHGGSSITLSPHDEISENRRLQGYKSIHDFDSEHVTDDLLSRHRVYLDISENRYRRVLTNLRREVRTLLEETGSANLYLTLGSLMLERPAGPPAEAPLFLVPVTLSNRSGRSHFEITADTSQLASPNYCLVEWLRQRQGVDIVALAQPPLDHSGLDIEAVISQISSQLFESNLPFKVTENAHLIITKFSTYGMWKDLHEHWETFMKTAVFRHIALSPEKIFDDPAGTKDLRDTVVNEHELPLPLPADGAQLRAITAAGQGRSFVLEGPPGTGKSQTITNLVAHCMAQGKSVLFVAEKQAALEVVSGRLQRVGLEPFTLNLHGQEQSPANIREQLKQTIDAEVRYDGQAWDYATKDLVSRLEPLINYPHKVHETNAVGHSLWTAAASKTYLGSGPTLVIEDHYVRAPSIEPHTVIKSVKELAKLAPSISFDSRERWGLVGDGAAELDSSDFAKAWQKLESGRAILENNPDLLFLLEQEENPKNIIRALEIYQTIPNQERLTAASLAKAQINVGRLRTLHTQLKSLAKEASEVRSVFSPIYITDGPYQQLLEAADAATKGLFGRKKRLAAYIEQLKAAVPPEKRDSIDAEGAHTPESIRGLLLMIEPVRSAAMRLHQDILATPGLQSLEVMSPLDPDLESRVQLRIEQLEFQFKLHQEYPWLQTIQTKDFDSLMLAAQQVPEAWQQWIDTIDSDEELLSKWLNGRSWTDAWLYYTEGWRSDIASHGVVSLRKASDWQHHQAILVSAGLESVLTQLDTQGIQPADAELAIRRGMADTSIRERISTFHLEDFESQLKVENLNALQESMDRVRTEATRALPAQLLARRPYKQGRVEGRVGELRRLLDAQRNPRSFRSLFAEYGREIQILAPCFFVSPTSSATYLQPGSDLFDVVVFDEASQITVDQAMGSLGRARSTIIVGDSKQMPPTRVGKTNLDNDEFDEETEGPEDLESILAEAVESQVPRLWLTWHYRSQDESLIAFSNAQYYEHKLASLPSPGAISNAGVELRRVDGQFQRKKGKGLRTNHVEAKAIVEEITNRLNSPLTADESIGAVTFNIQQRNLVLDLLDNSNDPLVQSALVQENEPIFVKNLENVQGDERDVILFSTAFSRHEDGRQMPLNFGPLSRKGGEKRLNVAITRARRKVILFSSFDPHEINLARTKSKGMIDLRSYMELARDGAEHPPADSPFKIDENIIRDQIATKLKERDWEVQTNYGLSSFTLDLVVRPRHASHWHIAILLDSPRWADMPTVADRDLTPELLEPLMSWAGVVRVWLPEWLNDPGATVQRIERELAKANENILQQNAWLEQAQLENEERLEKIREESRAQVAKHEAARNAALVEMEIDPAEEVDEFELEELIDDLLNEGSLAPNPQIIDAIQWDVDDSAEARDTRSFQSLADNFSDRVWEDERVDGYTYVKLLPIPLGERDEISNGLTKTRLESCRDKVEQELINVSGPLLLTSLQSAIARGFDRSRTSKSLNKNIDRLIPQELIFDDGTGSKFVWPRHTNPRTWQKFRASEGDRTVNEIPLPEIQNAMRHVQQTMDIADDEDLFRKTMQFFGLKRLTNNTSARLKIACDGLEI